MRNRVFSIARRIGRIFCSVIRLVPLTWRGVAALPILVGLFYAYVLGRNDRILFSLTLFGLAVMILSGVFVVITSLWLKLRKQRFNTGPLNFEAGAAVRTGYWLGWPAWNPLVKIDVAWHRPAGVAAHLVAAGVRLVEEVTAEGRAASSQIVRRFHVGDVFGLTRFSVSRRATQEVTIRPARGRASHFPPLAQYIPGDQREHPEGARVGELIEMRRYMPGDPLKLVLWKAYARTGRMLVRMPERAVARCQKTRAYLVASEADEAAAGIARGMLERDALGTDVVFGADGSDAPARTLRDAIEQIVRSANARASAGEGLRGFLRETETLGETACVVFVPHRPGPWLDRVRGALAGRRGPCQAVVGIDGIRMPPPWSWHRVLTRATTCSGAPLAEIHEVCRTLSGFGLGVWIVDRISGRSSRPAELPKGPGVFFHVGGNQRQPFGQSPAADMEKDSRPPRSGEHSCQMRS